VSRMLLLVMLYHHSWTFDVIDVDVVVAVVTCSICSGVMDPGACGIAGDCFVVMIGDIQQWLCGDDQDNVPFSF